MDFAGFGTLAQSAEFSTKFDKAERSGFPVFRDMMITLEKKALAEVRCFNIQNPSFLMQISSFLIQKS